jgi:haloalkane dehalogenase
MASRFWLSALMLLGCGDAGESAPGRNEDNQTESVMPTPDAGSSQISAEFPFESRFVEVEGSRLHYIDEGEGDPILFLHGNPTSSYLWRNVIPHLTPYGRVIALDLIGMGRSDKPDIEYRFFDHVRYVEGFIAALGLADVTLVVHDWGSGLGFHYASRHEENVKGIAFMEAIITPLSSWDEFPAGARETFQAFRTPDLGWEMIVNQNVFVEQVLPGAILRTLTDAEMDRYREPYLEPASRKPVWRWPNEIPIEGEPPDVVEAVAAYNMWLRETELPKLLFHATPGAIVPPPVVEWCRENLSSLKTVDLGAGIHFLQEDHPHEIGAELANWYRTLGEDR